jgi:hypothetical protein
MAEMKASASRNKIGQQRGGSRSISQVAGAVAQFVLLHRGKASSI